MGFKQFLESWQTLPDLIGFVHNFFNSKLSPKTLLVYADYLEERGLDQAAHLFREIGKVWRDPQLKIDYPKYELAKSLMDIIGWDNCKKMNIHDMRTYWLITQREDYGYAKHMVEPGGVSYRVSLINGKWFFYNNNTDTSINVVTRNQSTPNSITVKNYVPIDVREVPENILMCVFGELLKRQVKGF